MKYLDIINKLDNTINKKVIEKEKSKLQELEASNKKYVEKNKELKCVNHELRMTFHSYVKELRKLQHENQQLKKILTKGN